MRKPYARFVSPTQQRPKPTGAENSPFAKRLRQLNNTTWNLVDLTSKQTGMGNVPEAELDGYRLMPLLEVARCYMTGTPIWNMKDPPPREEIGDLLMQLAKVQDTCFQKHRPKLGLYQEMWEHAYGFITQELAPSLKSSAEKSVLGAERFINQAPGSCYAK